MLYKKLGGSKKVLAYRILQLLNCGPKMYYILKSKAKIQNAQTSWARKRSWYENMLWLIAPLEYKQF